jgi:hypothetical protein
MKLPNMIEDDLDVIRLKIYDETKDMSQSEFIAYINDAACEVLRSHGISPVKLVREKQKTAV